MSIHNQSNDLLDRSLQRSLKNWTAHEWDGRTDPPSTSRQKLLDAAQLEISAPQPRLMKFSKQLRLTVAWLFHSNESQLPLPIHSVDNIRFEYMDFLKTRMAFL